MIRERAIKQLSKQAKLIFLDTAVLKKDTTLAS